MNKVTNEADKLLCGVDKPVHVNAYLRFRNGHSEFVREHFRRPWGTLK